MTVSRVQEEFVARLAAGGGGERLGVRLKSPELFQTRVSIPSFTGSLVVADYSTLPANRPATYHNFVALWQDTVVPWGVPPLKREAVQGDSPAGSLIVTGVAITKNAYTLGYGVGPDLGSICASATIQPGGLLANPNSVSISLGYVGTTALYIHYETLTGYLPKANRNWVGLWKGRASPYNAPPPLARAAVGSDSSVGAVAFNDLEIAIESQYTICYIMGDEIKMAAATLYFETTTDGLQGVSDAPLSLRFASAASGGRPLS